MQCSILRQLGMCGMVPGIEHELSKQGLNASMGEEGMKRL